MLLQTDPNQASQVIEWVGEYGVALLVGMLVLIAFGVLASSVQRPTRKDKSHKKGGPPEVG